MSRYWLNYRDLSGRLIGAVVIDSHSLSGARHRATAECLDQDLRYCDGHELGGGSATLVPPGAVGRMLGLEEVVEIVQRLDQSIPETGRRRVRGARGSISTKASRLEKECR